MILAATLERLFAVHARRIAVITRGRRVTYEQLREDVSERARLFESWQVRREVLVPADNSYDALVAVLACIASSKVPLLFDAKWPTAYRVEMQTALGVDAIPSDATGRHGYAEIGERPPLASFSPLPSTEVIRFTTGSTGRPKAIEFSGDAVCHAARGWKDAAGYDSSSVVMCLAALNNGLCFNTSLFALFEAGGCLVLYNGPLLSKAILRQIDETRANYLVAFPYVYEKITSEGRDFCSITSRLRYAFSAAAKLDNKTNEVWYRMTGRWVSNYYGIAEAGPVTFNDSQNPNTLGTPLPGCDIRIKGECAQSGRLMVRTRSLGARYFGESGYLPIDDDGFLLTSDLGEIDADGLRLTGRADNVSNRHGIKIDLEELSRDIVRIGALQDCHVRLNAGGEIEALIVGSHIDETSLRAACRRLLPASHVPARVITLPRLPRSASGKIIAEAIQF